MTALAEPGRTHFDVVRWLREEGAKDARFDEAADEIERLRAQRDAYRTIAEREDQPFRHWDDRGFCQCGRELPCPVGAAWDVIGAAEEAQHG